MVRPVEGSYPELLARADINTAEDRTAFLCETLQGVWNDACKRFGNNPKMWRWGDLHKGRFDHALTPLECTFDVGPLDKVVSAPA